MLVRITWVNGAESDLEMNTLRELDTFVAQHRQPGVGVDLKPLDEGLRLLFTLDDAPAAPPAPAA
jgi:hypothetical protein